MKTTEENETLNNVLPFKPRPQVQLDEETQGYQRYLYTLDSSEILVEVKGLTNQLKFSNKEDFQKIAKKAYLLMMELNEHPALENPFIASHIKDMKEQIKGYLH